MHHGPSNDHRMDPARERDLVARSRADPAAFGELYDFYLPRIFAFVARRVRDRAAVEDLTAMTFERALLVVRRDDFRNESFGGWLYRVATNAIVDQARRERHAIPLGIRASDGPGAAGDRSGHEPGDESAAAAFAAAIDRDQLRRGLAAVAPQHRQVLVLRFLDGLEPVELAAVLGCSRSAAAVRVHRALRALRETMARESTDAA
jgi:RNA polymerase sigma-70 factor (ECF subfamily)